MRMISHDRVSSVSLKPRRKVRRRNTASGGESIGEDALLNAALVEVSEMNEERWHSSREVIPYHRSTAAGQRRPCLKLDTWVVYASSVERRAEQHYRECGRMLSAICCRAAPLWHDDSIDVVKLCSLRVCLSIRSLSQEVPFRMLCVHFL